MSESITFTIIYDNFTCPFCMASVKTPHTGRLHTCSRCGEAFWRGGVPDTTQPPACDNCRFARGYSCCAHPVTIPFPRRRWCGEYQEKAP